MPESTQHKLDRIRPPRVQITYDVEIGDAIVKKEIPFVVGILAELSGKNQDKLLPLKERKFVEIDRDNFDKVMAAAHPEIDVKAFNWIETGDLKMIKIFRELHTLGSGMKSRSAKTFIFHKAEEIVGKAVTLLKEYAPDKVKEIDALLEEIRDKADNSGELDDAGSDYLRRFTKLLKHFKLNIAGKEKTLNEKFVPVLDKLLTIPAEISDGKYNSAELRDLLDETEEAVTKDVSTISSTFKFNVLDDFSPLRILHQIAELKEFHSNKQYLSDLLNKMDGNAFLLKTVTDAIRKIEEERGDGDYDDAKITEAITSIMNTVYPAPEAPAPAEGEEAPPAAPAESTNPYMQLILEKFFEQYKNMVIKEYAGNSIEPNHVIKMLIEYIADINELLVNQVNEFIHAPNFQKLEASWRGLNFLVKNTETGERLKLRLLNISKDELQKDLEKAVEFDQSQLFKKVYEEEYGTFGGHPYGTLLGDFYFSRSAKDVALLNLISNVASAAHAPFIAGSAPELFDLSSFRELPEHRDLNGIFESLEMIKYNSFRDSEDSRYVTLTLPRVLIRMPYGPDTLPVEGFDFVEDVDGRNHAKYLWANSAYALTQRITDAFAKYSWCAAIRGVEGGGLVEGLPAHVFDTDSGDKALKCPTEIAITDRREKELSDLGFISLVHCKGKDYAAFFGGQTTQKPKKYDTPQANANARLSAVLPYILAASRFAHYLKVIVRDKVGSFMTADNVQVYLNRWIGAYVLGKDDAGQEIKAQYPLREARVDVSETPGKPGCYTAVVFLRPHFQLEELTTSIRLVAELPPPAA
jgi:type VI secretion system protein ImpC